MATLADMKARIADELARGDLGTQIASAITTAITEYQKERFRFSDVTPTTPPTFNTVADRWIYTAADNANIADAKAWNYIFSQVGNYLRDLTKSTPEMVRSYNQLGTMHGQPIWYAYEGNQLLIAPVPDTVYPITLGIFRNVAAPADDAEADNPWMNEAELLIRSRAKYEIALHVTRNPTMQQAMSPLEPGGEAGGHAAYYAWQSLKRETNRVTKRGRLRPMAF
jgi:hypothetical protein